MHTHTQQWATYLPNLIQQLQATGMARPAAAKFADSYGPIWKAAFLAGSMWALREVAPPEFGVANSV